VVASLLVNLLVAIGLVVYGGGMPPQLPRRINSHPQPSGGPFGDSPTRGLLGGNNMIKTHLEDRHLIHMLDFIDG
jgi:hypothetical protein